MNAIAVVDSGTTSTRLRVWDGAEIRWVGRRMAGARDTAREGHPGSIERAIAELISEARHALDHPLTTVVCSGMITSDLGLHPVPHLPAPASLAALAAGVASAPFPSISTEPVRFIPGVKTLPDKLQVSALERGDLLRGEEVEVTGLRNLLGLDRASAFVHFGSHHKVIDVAADGTIEASRTALTGELLAALCEHTILRSSTTAAENITLEQEAVLAGAKACAEQGFGRAAFLVRVGAQLAQLGNDTTTSFLIGALAALDLPLLRAGDDRDIILYGHGLFPQALAWLLETEGRPATRVDGDVTDRASVVGALQILAHHRHLGGMT
jgi:2-dehydro-3-deoxygalactonokinase